MSIEERLAAAEKEIATLKSIVESLRPVDVTGDKYADFTIRRCPPSWIESGGPDYTGQPISSTTPEFCDAIASFLDWTAVKDEAKNYSYVNQKGDTVFPAKFARKDAARARAFAVKMRATPRRAEAPAPAPRRQAPTQANLGDSYDDSEIPF